MKGAHCDLILISISWNNDHTITDNRIFYPSHSHLRLRTASLPLQTLYVARVFVTLNSLSQWSLWSVAPVNHPLRSTQPVVVVVVVCSILTTTPPPRPSRTSLSSTRWPVTSYHSPSSSFRDETYRSLFPVPLFRVSHQFLVFTNLTFRNSNILFFFIFF